MMWSPHMLAVVSSHRSDRAGCANDIYLLSQAYCFLIALTSKYAGSMSYEQALNPDEERLWRSLLHIIVALPRSLDDDLIRATGVTLTEYTALMNLSEAPNRQLRVCGLADVMGLSASRVSRLVDQLASHGLAYKTRSPDDGRGYIVAIADDGLHRLQRAYPEHLASARRRVVDQLTAADISQIAQVLSQLADQLWSARPRAG
jgi:DNA-binding MarR family transcriptional regulator